YENEDNKKIMKAASSIEANYYMKFTRLEELIKFCQETGLSHLGIAFCIGLEEEAKILYGILERYFKLSSVCCKVGGIDKGDFDLPKIKGDRYEATCNPIGQAIFLNNKKTSLNIIFGLCIGHDILFSRYSEAPVTNLVVKDRVLAHNPLGVINSRYYRKKMLNLNIKDSCG
ncbi:MAG: DUF1847 domain-containing protein, partial [Thermodesulfobacteriota bacterium]|nr:DUF1847 domain-containing protein [Thermodesulfobacteriota bacterium]